MESNSTLATAKRAKRSGVRRSGWQATGGPGVVRMLCMMSYRTSRFIPVCKVSSRNSSRRLSGGVPPVISYTLGIDGGAVWAAMDS